MGQKTVRTWDAAEQLANELERDGSRVISMSEERSGVRVTWGAAEQPAGELKPGDSHDSA